MSQVIVLGAKGRFGRAAVAAFQSAGWAVTAFGRNWTGPTPDAVRRIEGNAGDQSSLAAACQGQDVIVNAINPPYEKWARELPVLTQAVIFAAQASGATVMIPGNVYNYGSAMPPVLRETTPWCADTQKGKLRMEMENAYRAAGIRTIILRGGDFIERQKTGNWFDSHIAAKSVRGRTSYPGPLDRVHAWAYLPDMARAMEQLARRRDTFEPFEEFGFEGFNLTGSELVALIAKATGREQRIAAVPWKVLRLLALVSPQIREVLEMRYLWQVPHALDGTKLRTAIPDFAPTPPEEALRRVLTQIAPQSRDALSFSAHSA